jgi:S-adenosylmethionine hydrolase
MSKVITLTTDFGDGPYVAAMKGVILFIAPEINIIDICHTIRPQEINEGAYVLYSTAPYFKNAVHVGVVDPGVGTERAGLIIQCENGFLVGPDNGLLIPCARKLGLKKVYKISNSDYFLDEVSYTFHGRDIFAPVAAHLSKGVGTEEIGELKEDFVDLNFEYYVEKENRLEGKVIFIDNFGNLISSIQKEIIKKHLDFGDQLEIEVEGAKGSMKKKVRFLKSYSYGEKGEVLATISSSGFFEISCNCGSAYEVLGAEVDSPIKILF